SLGVLIRELFGGVNGVTSESAEQLKRVFDRATAQLPEHRFASVEDLRREFEKALKPKPKGPVGWLVVVAAAAAVVLVPLFLFWNRTGTPAIDPTVLRWGGSTSGGAPYVFEEQGKLTGFEKELADWLGRQVHREAKFVQREWDLLPQALQRRD